MRADLSVSLDSIKSVVDSTNGLTTHHFVIRIVSHEVSDLPKLKSLVEKVKVSKESDLIAAAVAKSGLTLRNPTVNHPLVFSLVMPNLPELLVKQDKHHTNKNDKKKNGSITKKKVVN